MSNRFINDFKSGGGSPGGANGSVQFNNSGVFGGFGNWDGTTFDIGTGHLFKGQYSNEAGSAYINPDGSAVFASGTVVITNAGALTVAGFKLTTAPTVGYVLTSDAAGVGTWQPSSGGGGTPGGSNGDIQYNNSGSFGGRTVIPVPNGGSGVTGIRTDVATTGNIANQAVASTWLNFTGSAQIVLTGLVAQADGTEITVTNDTSVGLFVAHQNTLSTAANRIITPYAVTTVFYPGESIKLRYDGNVSRWRYSAAVVVSTGSTSGGINFADGNGGWINDGTNILYSLSTHRLQLNNIYVVNESDLGGNTRLIGNVFGTADGLIPFSYTSTSGSGTITADPDLYWDNTNKRLGLGTQSPLYRLHVEGETITIGPPSTFTATLVLESLISPGTDTVTLIYGPQDPSSAVGNPNITESGYFAGSDFPNLPSYLLYSYRIVNGVKYKSPNGDSFGGTPSVPYPIPNGFDNGSAENPSYSGYTNNDNVSASVYPYRIVNGIQYASSSPFGLTTINLSNNPSGIDWNWTAASNSDSSAPDGYIIVITDNTIGSNYSYDVGNVLTYADMNVGGSVTINTSDIPYGVDLNWSAAANGDGSAVDGYILYAIYGAQGTFINDLGNVLSYSDTNQNTGTDYTTFTSTFTAVGQTFSFDLFAAPFSPSFNTYYNDNGNGYNINIADIYGNNSYIWVQHIISSTGGNSWRELEDDMYIAGAGFDGVGDQTFIQTSPYNGSATTTPNHYGIQSDGSTLNRDYEAYSHGSSIFSSTDLTASIFDPSDSQYYSITYTQINPSTGVRVLEQINGGGFNTGRDTSDATFYQDALGGGFSGSNTVTPTSLASTTAIFESDTATNLIPQVIIKSTFPSGPAIILFNSNGTDVSRIYASGGATLFLQAGGVEIQNFTGQSIPVTFGTSAAMDNQGKLSLGGTNPSSAILTLASGTTSITQILFATSTLPTSPVNGGIEFNGTHWFGSDNSTRRMFIESATATGLTNHKYPQADVNSRLIDGFIDDTYSGSTAISTNFRLAVLFTAGLALSTGQSITMGGGGTYAGGIRTTFGTGNASTSLNVNNHSPIFVFTGSTSGRTLTLPTAASISGTVFEISNEASVSVTVATTSSQNINTGTGTVTSLVLLPGDRIKFIATASSTWDATSYIHNIQPVANGGTGQTTLLGAGVVTVVSSVFEKSETGSDANVLTYTTGATDEFLNLYVATDVSAITGTSIVVTVTWKDSNNATATSTLTLTAIGDGTINIPINAKTATNVVVSTVFVGVSTAYKISAAITRLK